MIKAGALKHPYIMKRKGLQGIEVKRIRGICNY